MDTQQMKVAENAKQVNQGIFVSRKQSRMTFYRKGELPSEIIEMNLPADPKFMEKYFARGFVLDPNQLKGKAHSVEQSQEGFTCEECGKTFPKRIALTGHMRSHKK